MAAEALCELEKGCAPWTMEGNGRVPASCGTRFKDREHVKEEGNGRSAKAGSTVQVAQHPRCSQFPECTCLRKSKHSHSLYKPPN